MECLTRVSIASRLPWPRRQRAFVRYKRSCLRAQESEGDVEVDDAEDRIARLEAAARGRDLRSEDTEVADESITPKRKWKKGEMLPENWEELSTGQKAWEIYAGERGALFWANRVALIAAIVVGVSWILFRFVGPQVGLYDLKSTFSS